jgi:hypothetical protein
MSRRLFRTNTSHRRGATVVRSDDGVVEFALAAVDGVLFVKRVRHVQGTARVSQSALFRDSTSFARWCDADAARFDYPLVHVQLKRRGSDLLGG